MFDHRAVVVGQTRDELLAGLAGVVAGRPEAGVVCGVGKPAGKTAFVFAGQGSQWLGMGSELYAAYPVFAEALDAVVDELDRHLRYPLRDVIWGHDQDLLNTTEFAQPALFAVEVALYRLVMSWGCGRVWCWVIRWASWPGARRRGAVFAGCGDAGGRAWTVDAGVARRRRHVCSAGP